MPISYRVGNVDNTSQATSWVQEEFGINANQLGHLNPQIVRQMSIDAREMAKQVQMAKVFVKEAKNIMNGKVEIEQLRKELLEHGLASKEEVDEVVKQMILLTEKHKGHIAKMLQEMMQGKALINARSKSSLELSKSAFQHQLRELRARHNAALGDQNDAHREVIAKIGRDRADAKNQRIQSKKFTDYITARDEQQRRYEIGSGGMPASLISRQPVGGRSPAFGQKSLLGRLFG